jgi:hypothetical protein
VLRVLIAATIVSTAVHFTHNVVEIESYPSDPISDEVIQVAAVISWPLYTAIAIYAYRLYTRRRFKLAHPLLAAYGLFAMTSLGHFLNGVPDVPAFWLGTVFTDILGGASVLAFAISSMRSRAGLYQAAS